MNARAIRRSATLLLAVPVLIVVAASVAFAAGDGPVLIDDANRPVVVLTGWLDVPEGVTVDDAIIFDGDATIEGEVNGTALAINGDITISGVVHGDVASLSGRVIVEDGGQVGGNITSNLPPQIEPGATVEGQITQNKFNVDVVLFGRVAFWIAASVASLLFGLLLILFAPRAADAAARAGRGRIGPSIGWGLLLFIGVPIIGGVALVTIVGALFGVAILTGMVLLYLVAYAAGALTFGRLLLKEPRKPALAFLLGWVILRVLALVPVLGGFLFAAAAVWGFGALTVAAFKAGRTHADEPAGTVETAAVGAASEPSPTPPPMPPAP